MKVLSMEFGVIRYHFNEEGPLNFSTKDRVLDGDTLMIAGQRWRLYGYDAPELRGNCCETEAKKAKDATNYLQQLLCWGASNGTLEIDVLSLRETFKGRLVTIRVGGEDVGEIMHRHGLALPYVKGEVRVFCDCPEKVASRDAKAALVEKKRQRAFEQKRVRRLSG